MSRNVLVGFLVLLALFAHPTRFSGAEVDRRGAFVVETADGQAPRGALRAIRPDWSVRVGDGGAGTLIAGEDVSSVRRLGVNLPAFPSGDQLVLSNGDRLGISAVTLQGEKLSVRAAGLSADAIELPLNALAVYWKAAPEGVWTADQYLRRLVRQERKRDTVYLLNGDRFEGVLDSLDREKVVLEVAKKAVTIELHRVSALALGSDAAPAKSKGIRARVTLSDGTRLTLQSVTCADGATLDATTWWGGTLRIPLSKVVGLDFVGGKTLWLSDLSPARIESMPPYLGVDSFAWPPMLDASADERDLRLGGATYDKGIGTHAPCRIRYALAGGYRRFEALVGLDDVTGKLGSVGVRLIGDGKALDVGLPPEVTQENGPIRVKANVTGMKELTLEVNVGRGGNVQDHVDWVDCRLIR